MLETEDNEVIAGFVECLNTESWKRKASDSSHKDLNGLPDTYINLDNKYQIDFWAFENECCVHMSYHSSRIMIGTYEVDIQTYNECVEYLSNL